MDYVLLRSRQQPSHNSLATKVRVRTGGWSDPHQRFSASCSNEPRTTGEQRKGCQNARQPCSDEALHQVLKRKERSRASATGEKLPPTSSTYGRVEHRHRELFQSGTGIEREQRQGLFTKKSLACSTPPGTYFPSLITTPLRY